ncbi:putative long-chain-fatty-acid CoA ligase [Pseudooceanicola nanhaiensis]|jgi:acyl-CoA synthetase (AMP-forming)/AMP-acid ligase II|uniref:3-methylmercaptopropionyl-CoA ligase n=1 Tax=Pseudooceanicola nanhaiensis TaxID=375761 RepID=A0A917T689_9RHOB|nr:long-chain-fatty-acid--CoA ligase [Pseudooceanicola nanhaiensis]GGM10587.1 putative long-chain-fatty-acid CoA ligase [Pseudooceanicola nanhaiensis]
MIRYPDLIRKYAFHRPDHIATHYEGRDHSWRDFSRRVHGMAQVLVERGVAPGDRVAYLGLNSHWLVEMYFVPSVIGAISVPINHRLSEDEMVEVVADCAPAILIVDRHFADRAAALMERCPTLTTLIYADWDKPGATLPEGTLHYDTLADAAGEVPDHAFDDRASRSDETMILFYTSGTTGRPKGVMLSHSNFLVNATGSGHLYGYRQDDVLLLSGPLFHLGTGSRVFTAVAYGTTMVVQPKFDVEETMRMIEERRISTMTMVPTMLRMVMDHPDFEKFDFSSIRVLTYGASPMPVSLMERAIEAIPGITFCQGYGLTETSPVLSVLEPADHVPGNPMIGKLSSVGRPILYSDLRIVDENDRPLPPGQPGEIVVRGPQVTHGYWNRPEETAQAMRNGFFHTGDAGYMDEDGYLYIAGRTKEMIISGGENVYPIETENALCKHPAVAQAAVFGVPHEKWGEMVYAVVALRTGQSVTTEELIAFCRERIAHYKAPRGMTIWAEALPLSATNKIDKTALKRAVLEGVPA